MLVLQHTTGMILKSEVGRPLTPEEQLHNLRFMKSCTLKDNDDKPCL